MTNLESPFLARVGLFRRRSCWVPTLRAWLSLALAVVAAGILGVRWLYPFLAVTDRVDTRVLVVEGWLPDFTRVDGVLREIQTGHYDLILVTGGPTPKRELLAEFGTYPDLARGILVARGVDPGKIVAVPSLGVARDRTYASAVALKRWMDSHSPAIHAFNLFTLGAHGRRSRLLFEEAFGGDMRIGVISSEELRYDRYRWWRSSAGVRDVIGEALAYLYARLIFRP